MRCTHPNTVLTFAAIFLGAIWLLVHLGLVAQRAVSGTPGGPTSGHTYQQPYTPPGGVR